MIVFAAVVVSEVVVVDAGVVVRIVVFVSVFAVCIGDVVGVVVAVVDIVDGADASMPDFFRKRCYR